MRRLELGMISYNDNKYKIEEPGSRFGAFISACHMFNIRNHSHNDSMVCR